MQQDQLGPKSNWGRIISRRLKLNLREITEQIITSLNMVIL